MPIPYLLYSRGHWFILPTMNVPAQTPHPPASFAALKHIGIEVLACTFCFCPEIPLICPTLCLPSLSFRTSLLSFQDTVKATTTLGFLHTFLGYSLLSEAQPWVQATGTTAGSMDSCQSPFTPAWNPFLGLWGDFYSWCFLLKCCLHLESWSFSNALGCWNSEGRKITFSFFSCLHLFHCLNLREKKKT